MGSGPYALASFEDQFENESGQNTSFSYKFEIPFDCTLIRASVGTKSETSGLDDAYITIVKNVSDSVVDAGAPGSRNLPVVTNSITGVALPNIDCAKGDSITVTLHLEATNVVDRAKVVLAYGTELKKLNL